MLSDGGEEVTALETSPRHQTRILIAIGGELSRREFYSRLRG